MGPTRFGTYKKASKSAFCFWPLRATPGILESPHALPKRISARCKKDGGKKLKIDPPRAPHGPPSNPTHRRKSDTQNDAKNQSKRGGVVCAIRAAARHKNLHGREYACPSADCKFSSREKKMYPRGIPRGCRGGENWAKKMLKLKWSGAQPNAAQRCRSCAHECL